MLGMFKMHVTMNEECAACLIYIYIHITAESENVRRELTIIRTKIFKDLQNLRESGQI